MATADRSEWWSDDTPDPLIEATISAFDRGFDDIDPAIYRALGRAEGGAE